MKPMSFVGNADSAIAQSAATFPSNAAQPLGEEFVKREPIRHILIGSPVAVRQTIHLLHTLNYAETILWTPLMDTKRRIVIAPERGEVMSLLRKHI